MRPSLTLPAAAALLATAALLAPLAHAETTRADYVAQAEPICQQNTDANERILKGVRARAKQGKLRAAGNQFARAATAFGQTVQQIAAIPQPPGDAATLASWLNYLNLETTYLGKIAKALKAGRRGQAQGFAVRLQRNANFANGAVTGFGFSSCLIDPSRFT